MPRVKELGTRQYGFMGPSIASTQDFLYTWIFHVKGGILSNQKSIARSEDKFECLIVRENRAGTILQNSLFP